MCLDIMYQSRAIFVSFSYWDPLYFLRFAFLFTFTFPDNFFVELAFYKIIFFLQMYQANALSVYV